MVVDRRTRMLQHGMHRLVQLDDHMAQLSHFLTRPWTAEDAARRKATTFKASQSAKPKPAPIDPRAEHVAQLTAEHARLTAALEKREREDEMARQVKDLQAEQARLTAELEKKERRAKGFAGRVKLAGGAAMPFRKPTKPAA